MSSSQPVVCLFAAAVFAHAFQTPAAVPAKGAIEGQVVNARTGAPLKRAMVRIVGSVPAPIGAPAPATPAGITVTVGAAGRGNTRPVMINKETDDQGRFSIPNLDPGKYRVTAERQGFLRQSWGARKYSGGSTPVAVAEGQTVKSVDFRLMPQGVISGKVLDEDGEPMAGVQVRAQRSYVRNGVKVWNTVANGNTSDIGEYRLPELKPGRYSVVASPRPGPQNMTAAPGTDPLPDKPEMTYAATYYPSTPDASVAAPVDVGEGGEVPQIDIRLVKSRVFRVRGRVIGLPEALAGRRGGGMVPVTLTPRQGGRGGESFLMGQARGAEGEFEIRNVPAGQYLAHAQTQGGAQQQYVATAQVDVIGSHADGVVLRMATGGDVQGSIKVIEAAAPIETKNLQVSLRPVGFGGQAPRARAGEDLKFTLKSVPPIRYAVNVSGYPDTCFVKSIQYAGADVTAEGVEMTNGGVIEVVLSATAAQVDVVVSAGENKVAGAAQVVVMKEGLPDSVRTADENGMLSLKGLKPGSYRILAWEDVDPEQLWDPDYLRKFENEGKSVKLDGSAHETIMVKAIPAQ